MEFDFVNRLELEYFRPFELLKHTDSPGNTEPPRYMWGNIVPTILILDELRRELQVPIVLKSVYRAPNYNQKQGGKPLSLHQAFSAVDFKAKGVSPTEVCETLREWRGRWFASPVPIERVQVCVPKGCIEYRPLQVRTNDERGHEFQFAGGIGCYSKHVHIDTRGIDRDWIKK